jgi:hypothetical protein
MKNNSIDLLSSEFEDSGVEEIDLTEGAMYKRAFKKFYYKQKNKILSEDEENDCEDIENEIEDIELNISDEDVEIEEEDLQ